VSLFLFIVLTGLIAAIVNSRMRTDVSPWLSVSPEELPGTYKGVQGSLFAILDLHQGRSSSEPLVCSYDLNSYDKVSGGRHHAGVARVDTVAKTLRLDYGITLVYARDTSGIVVLRSHDKKTGAGIVFSKERQ
jgi:hypothetical protein